MKEALKQMVLESVYKGQVKLASGHVSDFYIDGRQVTLRSVGAYYIACLMAEVLETVEYEAVGGPTMGADPIVGALCYHLFATKKKDIAAFIVRKETKGHGLQKLIEGPAFRQGQRVVIVEDVVTSGGSIIKAARAIEAAGGTIVKVLALVDREEGAQQTLSESGYDFKALFTRSELE
ncbi:MAG TPA: orotate phosphoribosyltransferase [Actinobacteria bacterium]|nr:orotate phosphoribosyltransferase [Actinomycetota bacterium]